MPAAEIKAFTEGRYIHDSALVRHLLQMAHYSLSAPRNHTLKASKVSLIRELARACDIKSYRAFMKKVIAALDEGPAGVAAARKTVRRALKLLHRLPLDVPVLQKINQVWVKLGRSTKA
jgi:hypothetical protein